MKDFLQKIKSLFTKATGKEPSYDRKILRPENDWAIILVGNFFAILICAAIAFYFYLKVDNGKMFASNEETIQTEVKVNMNLLKKTVDDWNSRAESLAKAKQGGIAPADPAK